MKNEILFLIRKGARGAVAFAAVNLLVVGVTTCPAQSPPPNLPPGVQDVVKLAHAGISDDVILAQIKNQGAFYNLTTDQILYLNSQGVSQPVMKALVSGNAAASSLSLIHI